MRQRKTAEVWEGGGFTRVDGGLEHVGDARRVRPWHDVNGCALARAGGLARGKAGRDVVAVGGGDGHARHTLARLGFEARRGVELFVLAMVDLDPRRRIRLGAVHVGGLGAEDVDVEHIVIRALLPVHMDEVLARPARRRQREARDVPFLREFDGRIELVDGLDPRVLGVRVRDALVFRACVGGVREVREAALAVLLTLERVVRQLYEERVVLRQA